MQWHPERGKEQRKKYGIKMSIWTDTPKKPTNKSSTKKSPKPVDDSVVASLEGITWPFFNVDIGLISDTTCQ